MNRTHRVSATAAALVLGTTALITGAPGAQAATTASCPTGVLPHDVLGTPKVAPGSAEGVYLWHGRHGWSLRTTHPGHGKVVVSGTIAASREMSNVHRVRLEHADRVVVGAHHRSISFLFTNYGYLDGIDFMASCAPSLTLRVSINGRPATTDQVFLGRDRVHPASVPVTVRRTPPASTPAAASSAPAA